LSYQVYENSSLIATTANTTLDNITFDTVGTYNFYVVALFGSIPSTQSNIVSVNIVPPPSPTLVGPIPTVLNPSNCNWIATLTWDYDYSCNYIYKVYENGALIGTVPPESYPFQVPINTLGNYFYVIALLGPFQSAPSNTVTINALPLPPAPTLSIDIVNMCSSATLSWTPVLPTCNVSYEIYDSISSVLIGTTTSTSYVVTLADCTDYIFYVIAVFGPTQSAASNTVSAKGLVTYTITSLVNTTYTEYSVPGYTAIVFDIINNFSNGTAKIKFCKPVTASILIVGGGGGGGAGDTEPTELHPGGGAGGGGGSITYLTNYTINASTKNVTIGFGGAGKSPGNGGQGNLTGQAGTASIFSGISSGGGVGGSGIGGGGGGLGGSSNSSSGGGGGGGGGAYRKTGLSGTPGVTKGGAGGTGLSGVNPGTSGSNSIYIPSNFDGGSGGASNLSFTTITLPFIPVTLNLGGGGGGGGSISGGGAGNGTGGAAGTSTLNPTLGYAGASALYGIANSAYGGGGGGGGIQNYTVDDTNIGGNGGNGTVIIWWPTC
jgi:hypothetical protein